MHAAQSQSTKPAHTMSAAAFTSMNNNAPIDSSQEIAGPKPVSQDAWASVPICTRSAATSGYCTVTTMVRTLELELPGATAMNFNVALVVNVIGPEYLVELVVGVVPLVV